MVKEENAILPAQELRSLPPEQALSSTNCWRLGMTGSAVCNI